MSDAIWIVLALICGFVVGWISAHETVAAECKKLGAFYVGSAVFECKVKTPPTPKE